MADNEEHGESSKKGGEKMKEEYGEEGFYSEIGMKSGEEKVDNPDVKSGELGKMGTETRWEEDEDEAS